MNNPIIKVCGMRDAENIRQVAALGIDWMGMVFCAKSPRNVTMVPTHAGIIPDRAPVSSASSGASADTPATPLRVGVFVDEMPQNIITCVVNFCLDLVQFHGNESPTMIRNLRATLNPDISPGIRFIKTIAIPAADRSACRDIAAACKDYADCVDYFLFVCSYPACDDSGETLPGSTGQRFDWSILDAYKGDVPFMLGGIGPDDAGVVRSFHHPKCMGIDLSYGFDIEPGMKDVAAIDRFLKAVRLE